MWLSFAPWDWFPRAILFYWQKQSAIYFWHILQLNHLVKNQFLKKDVKDVLYKLLKWKHWVSNIIYAYWESCVSPYHFTGTYCKNLYLEIILFVCFWHKMFWLLMDCRNKNWLTDFLTYIFSSWFLIVKICQPQKQL